MKNSDESPGFEALGLHPSIVAAATALGYEEPTAIQRAAIPVLIEGRDVLGQAATGTGKTAAFALPLLHRLGPAEEGEQRTVRAFVLVPTRELAMQVAEAVHKYGRQLGTHVLPVYGGQSMQQQLRALRRGVDVVVATPGRALDHIRRGKLNLDNVEYLVLDEADEMLDMGFAEDLEAIVAALPSNRQTALFSATMSPRIKAIAKKYLHDPAHVQIESESAAAKTARVREVAYVVQRPYKSAALARLLDMEDPTSAIVFCRTRTEVDELTETLGARGYQAEALHGGLSQEQRDRVLRRFRDNTSEILVATDVAARGLDIEHVSHVFNYDVPSSIDAYVHRIGRTGRAGREGVAITLAETREHRLLRNIERETKRKIRIEAVPSLTDLRERRLALLRGTVEEALDGDDLDKYRTLVEALSSDHDIIDVAAAALKLADQSGRDGEDVEIPHAPSAAEPKPRARASTNGDFAKIYIGLGRAAGVRPADLVGAIANEAGISSKSIGAIDIADRFSLVEVPASDCNRIIAALKNTTVRGRPLKPRRDRK